MAEKRLLFGILGKMKCRLSLPGYTVHVIEGEAQPFSDDDLLKARKMFLPASGLKDEK